MLKRRMLTAAVVVAIVAGAGGASPAWAGADDPVDVPDAKFRACINSSLGQPAGAAITASQAASIRHLGCPSHTGLSSLEGAQSLTNLLSLGTGSNPIEDLSPLAGLTSLMSLTLWATQVNDVSPLAGLPKLRHVELGNTADHSRAPYRNGVTDVSALAGLPAFSYFAVRHQHSTVEVPCGVDYENPVIAHTGTPAPLGGAGFDAASNMIDTSTPGVYQYNWDVPTIEWAGSGSTNRFTGTLTVTVECDDDPVNVVDSKFRECLNNQLGQTAGAVITESQAASIRHLECRPSGITSLAGAEALTNLVTLGAAQNHIEDLTPLAGLTTLQNVALSSNRIEDVSPLAGLTNLTGLQLHNPDWVSGSNRNGVTDLSSLAGLHKLASFQMYDQEAAISVPCGTPYPNPVIARNGTAVSLTGDGYDAASNTIDTTTPGTYPYTWNIPSTDWPGLWNHFTGTLTLTITC